MTTQDKSVDLDENQSTGDKPSESNKRNARIYIRVTDDEKAKIKFNAGNLHVTTFLRALGLRKQIKKHYIELSPKQQICDRNLKAIGNNLNQLVSSIHFAHKRETIDSTNFIMLLRELQKMNDSIETIENELASYRKKNVH